MTVQYTFFCKNKLYKKVGADIGEKKKEQIKGIFGWEIQKQNIEITMLFNSFKHL